MRQQQHEQSPLAGQRVHEPLQLRQRERAALARQAHVARRHVADAAHGVEARLALLDGGREHRPDRGLGVADGRRRRAAPLHPREPVAHVPCVHLVQPVAAEVRQQVFVQVVAVLVAGGLRESSGRAPPVALDPRGAEAQQFLHGEFDELPAGGLEVWLLAPGAGQD
jgi:hypothetical protein